MRALDDAQVTLAVGYQSQAEPEWQFPRVILLPGVALIQFDFTLPSLHLVV